jgi:hypothetical protein
MAQQSLRRRSGDQRRGLTVLEVTFSLAISTATLLYFSENVIRSGSALTASQVRTVQVLQGQRTSDEVAVLLKDAVQNSLTPDPTSALGCSDLSFSRLAGFDEGVPLWAAQERLFLRLAPEELLDGEDQDGDGLIDEHQLVHRRVLDNDLTQDRILINDLPALGSGESANGADDDGDGLIDEPGFCVRRQGDVLLVAISMWIEGSALEQTEPKVAESVRQIALRN